MPMHLDLIKRTHSTILNQMAVEDQLQVAQDCVETAFDLVWGKDKNYMEAVEILGKALHLYQSIQGKHHRDVGNICNYIGTAYWLQQEELGKALKYFLEARRIYCKSGQGRIKKLDGRIYCVLYQLGYDEEEIEEYQQAILRTIEHELQGDRLKKDGFHAEARKEYRKARRDSETLKILMASSSSSSS